MLFRSNKMNLASDYNMIGELYLEMDNLPDAQGNLHKALEVSQDIGSRPEIAESAYNLGILYKKMGRISKSKEFLRKAQEIYEQIDPVSYREVKEEILGLN